MERLSGKWLRNEWSPHLILIMYNWVKKFNHTTVFVSLLFVKGVHIQLLFIFCV